MKSGIRKDIKLRLSIDSVRNQWVLNKAAYRSKVTGKFDRMKASSELGAIFNKYGSPSMLVNYCVRTGESRSVITTFGRNRHIVRDIALRGKLPGVIKASW